MLIGTKLYDICKYRVCNLYVTFPDFVTFPDLFLSENPFPEQPVPTTAGGPYPA